MAITFGAGVQLGAGVSAAPRARLMLSLDAATYTSTTSGTQQNASGTSDNIGFFPYGWPAYGAIQPGWTCVQTGAVVTAVDGVYHVITTVGTPFTSGDSYTFTSANSWIDSVGNLPFILNGGVTYDSANGGSLAFDPGSSQYANCATSLIDLNNWTIEAWHYYTGTNTGSAPCIVSEVYPGSNGKINYVLGSATTNSPNLQAAFYNGGWQSTPDGYTLTSGNWYQIVGTYDGTTIKLYVNNILVEQSPATGLAQSSNGGINLMQRWDNPEYWGGNLAIVKIWGGDIKQSGVTSSWDANKTRFGYGLTTSFTINSGDISNPQNLYNGYSAYSSAGFTSDGNADLENGIMYDVTQSLHDSILAAQTNAGFDPRFAGVWNVSWNTGGIGLVRLGLINNHVVIAPIDQTDTRWQSGSFYGPTQAGSFTFPAVFTPHTPGVEIHGNDQWC